MKFFFVYEHFIVPKKSCSMQKIKRFCGKGIEILSP